MSFLVFAASGAASDPPAAAADPVADRIIALERGALARWSKGDPGGYLDIMASDEIDS